jgi:deoxyribodipyrimidine photo-lyase
MLDTHGTSRLSPYLRFGLVSPGKFDPAGDDIRRWVHELAKLPAPAIFAPWRVSPADLTAAGVRLGADYPHPMVDHLTARNRALARFREISPPAAGDRAGPRVPWPDSG